jgi:primosomal protein N'
MVLVPEIALTSHLVDTFAARIEKLAVIHSAVLPSKRYISSLSRSKMVKLIWY